MNILCIETSTDVCSVGLSVDGVVKELRESADRDHARLAAVYADQVTRGVRLDAVAVSEGPGSYTGLRIGVSLAKGICFGLDIPLLSVGSLEALAQVALMDHSDLFGFGEASDPVPGIIYGPISVPAPYQNAVLAPMLDARRMEVYTQLFDTAGHALSDVRAQIVDPGSFAEVDDPLVIFGPGAVKCAEVLPQAILLDVQASARGMAPLVEHAKKVDLAYFEPHYLKEFMTTVSPKNLVK